MSSQVYEEVNELLWDTRTQSWVTDSHVRWRKAYQISAADLDWSSIPKGRQEDLDFIVVKAGKVKFKSKTTISKIKNDRLAAHRDLAHTRLDTTYQLRLSKGVYAGFSKDTIQHVGLMLANTETYRYPVYVANLNNEILKYDTKEELENMQVIAIDELCNLYDVYIRFKDILNNASSKQEMDEVISSYK